MVINKIKELEAAKAKLAGLEKSIAAELNKELAALPGKYGFASVNAFVSALYGATGGKRRAGPSINPVSGKRRRTRAVITDATRSEVKKLVEAGKTGSQIAKTVGISLPSVQNIKKALGLVKKKR